MRLLPTGLLLLATTMAAIPAGPTLAQGFTPAQRQEIIGIVREALRTDPSLLREALEALEQAETQGREAQARAAIQAQAAGIFRDAADPVRGNPQGAVTLVAFFDPRCPYCKRMLGPLTELLRRQRDVRLVMKELPILGPASQQASRALLAAQRQGKYWEYHDALMALREEPSEAVLQREAGKLGLDWARMRRDMADEALQARLAVNTRLAQALGIEGTPAFVIGERIVPGAVDLATLEELVAANRVR